MMNTSGYRLGRLAVAAATIGLSLLALRAGFVAVFLWAMGDALGTHASLPDSIAGWMLISFAMLQAILPALTSVLLLREQHLSWAMGAKIYAVGLAGMMIVISSIDPSPVLVIAIGVEIVTLCALRAMKERWSRWLPYVWAALLLAEFSLVAYLGLESLLWETALLALAGSFSAWYLAHTALSSERISLGGNGSLPL